MAYYITNSMSSFLDKYSYKIFTTIIWVVFITPFLAPIFMHFGLELPAKFIYFIYSYTCHQFAHRSLHIFDYQCAWCTRDTFTWAALAVTTILVPRLKIKPIKWYWVLVFTIPIALDGGIQTISTLIGFKSGVDFYTSTNFTRAVTGGLFGLGIGLIIVPMIYELFSMEKLKSNLKIYFKISISVMAILISFYFFIVQVWQVTSTEYKPENFLDLAVRTPQNFEERWIRQAHGACKPDKPKTILGDGIGDFVFLPDDCF